MSGADDHSEKSTKSGGKMTAFLARLWSTVILWGLVVAVCQTEWPWLYAALLIFVGGLASYEVANLMKGRPGQTAYWGAMGVGLLMAGGLAWDLIGGEVVGFEWEVRGMVVVLVGAFLLQMRRPIKGATPLEVVGVAILTYCYLPVCFSAFGLRLMFWPELDLAVPGKWLVIFLIVSTKFTDMGAYLSGSLLGRNKMVPHISPAKTWEGFAGSLLFAQVGAWGIWWLGGDDLSWLAPRHVAVLGGLIAIAAVVGDLAESIIKRSLSAKDSGKTLPGIGGVLDLVDSMCFSAPVVYVYLSFFVK